MLISVDGSLGEGGGQILRTSLSLSLVTQKAFRIENLRAGREKPGLLRQHLTAVMAAAEISGGEVKGATLGSASVTFSPGKVRAGEYSFAVGAAGSATLIFQTVLPALMLADGPSKVVFEGGTHNHAAPPSHFLAAVFVPLIERIGPKVKLEFERYGFYPAGGGRFSLRSIRLRACARCILASGSITAQNPGDRRQSAFAYSAAGSRNRRRLA